MHMVGDETSNPPSSTTSPGFAQSIVVVAAVVLAFAAWVHSS
jgi:hypothetical protein